MLLTHYVLIQGRPALREPVEKTSLQEKGVRLSNALLTSLRAGAASVNRAAMKFGTLQEISFGIPSGLMAEAIQPAFRAFSQRWPEYTFTVSGEGRPLAVSLLVPAPARPDEVNLVIGYMAFLSGAPQLPPDWDQTLADILANRPALLTVVLNSPGDNDQLADLIGFTEYLAASLLLGDAPVKGVRKRPWWRFW